jgi:hypothetical protein
MHFLAEISSIKAFSEESSFPNIFTGKIRQEYIPTWYLSNWICSIEVHNTGNTSIGIYSNFKETETFFLLIFDIFRFFFTKYKHY